MVSAQPVIQQQIVPTPDPVTPDLVTPQKGGEDPVKTEFDRIRQRRQIIMYTIAFLCVCVCCFLPLLIWVLSSSGSESGEDMEPVPAEPTIKFYEYTETCSGSDYSFCDPQIGPVYKDARPIENSKVPNQYARYWARKVQKMSNSGDNYARGDITTGFVTSTPKLTREDCRWTTFNPLHDLNVKAI